MTRKFVKKSNTAILKALDDFFTGIGDISEQTTYDSSHANFCVWFIKNIQVAARRVRVKGVEKIIPAHSSSYGHAAKVLDIAAKVYVYYCALPSPDAANVLVPLLHGALDNQIIKDLIKKFPDEEIESDNLEDIDQEKYDSPSVARPRRDTRGPFANSSSTVR